MITPSYVYDEYDLSSNLSAHWNNKDSKDVIYRGIKDSFELYLGGIDYASRAMLLYQPLVVGHIKSGPSEDFWVYSAEALYDSCLLLVYNLFDADKKNKFKNLISLQKQIVLLKNPENKINWGLNPGSDMESVIERIKTYRDKGLAHHERAGIQPVRWEDPLVALNYVKQYLEKFHLQFLGFEFLIDGIDERVRDSYRSTLLALGIHSKDEQDSILEEFNVYLNNMTA